METQRFTVLEAIELQAMGCQKVGSQIYSALLGGLAGDYLSGGLTAELLDGVSEHPMHDAIPLRLLATGHRLALAGEAPELAAWYPSCGGSWNGEDLTDVFTSVVANHRHEFVAGMRRNVQTNEVGRAVVLSAGFSAIAAHHGLPLRTFEIGGSAGLLSHWPRYWYDTGESTMGDPASGLRFDESWFRGELPALHGSIAVVDRRSSDISPIDATTQDGRLTMLSFLWPDQLERRDRLRAALDVARLDPITVERADAGEWLARQLEPGTSIGTATVVFHSIVWQYLPTPTREAVRAALLRAGEGASSEAPLCWLRMEPANIDHADVRLTTWPGGHEQVLAHVGYHGAEVRWLG